MSPTNVSPQDLNTARYAPEIYDRTIRLVIPGHDELHGVIDSLVGQHYVGGAVTGLSILELGLGTGLTAERILRHVPDAYYMGIEFSEPMLAKARERLSRYNTTFICGDYAEVPFPQGQDLVVAVIGIHHQETDDDKRALFRKIADCLTPGGAFLFGDLVTFRSQEQAAVNEALHHDYMVEHLKDEDEQLLRDWTYHHKLLNKLAPLEDQMDWLREAGFRQVDVVFQKFQTALVYAQK